MHPVLRPRAAFLAAALASLAWTAPATAQTHEPPADLLPFPYDAGWAQNDGAGLEVVLSFPVVVAKAAWLRLEFAAVVLSGDPGAGTGSFLRITAMEDGAVQTLNAVHVAQWQKTTAYFNGEEVFVELLAYPGTGPNHLALKSVTAGVEVHDKSQCGATDDRVLSSDPRSARVLSVGCTGWIIDDSTGCFLTAGHCASGTTTVEFNVPLSTSSGTIRHPGPEDQYSVDPASRLYTYTGIGNDWCYFGVFPNSVTGLTPRQAQGSDFHVTAPPSYASGQQIRITGYGVDYNNPTYSQVQQTHSGSRINASGTVVEYLVDTEGGNSGSPVIFESTGDAIGIHTNGGCSPPNSGNLGTGANNTGLQTALANPAGVCDNAFRADFVGNPTTGYEPLLVYFTDLSTGTPISWSWTFGDGGTSAAQNPNHTYQVAGTYTVSLTASDGASNDTETKTGYIVVDPSVNAYTNPYNGSGINPVVYTTSDLPVLGTTWTVQIDGGSVGAVGLSFVVAYSAPLSGFFTVVGELLIDPSSAWMMTSIAGGAGGISTHNIPIPSDTAFLGVVAYTQGFLNNVGGAGLLANAIEAGLGY
ncbi:MAG: PKD domain-containing protein [Planctomycetota bacterium]